GTATTITVTVQNGTGCSGKVFVETIPLTEVDMQGSARLAVSVAGALTGIDISNYDFFFVIQTSAPIIGGPSAGAIMTIATIAALEGWELDNATMMTGMINPDGTIGPVGGIPQKIDAAYSVGARRFLVPKGQMEVYTTEVESVGGIISISKKKVNVSEYALQKYGMEVVEVEDINDALFYFTGHRFEEPVANQNITTENYTTSMKPLASYLIERANRSYNNASQMFNLSKSNIPNFFPFYYRREIEESLNDAKDALDEAESAYENKLFYSSTSKSFQSLISSRFVTYVCGYFSVDDKASYVENLLEDVRNLVNESSSTAKNATVKGMVSLQCVGAAQKRAFDAENYLEDAEQDYMGGNYLDALYEISFAMERCKSVGWWLNISKEFDDAEDVNETTIDEVASRYLDLAQNAVTYSSIILDEIGESSQLLSEARSLMNEAETEIDNYPASALFNSLESLAKANLAIELIGGVTEEKLNRARERAAISIAEDREIGIEPVLAVSYYEFAQSLENTSMLDSIVYYRYAQMIAGALNFMTNPSEKKESRFEGIPPINPKYTPPFLSWTSYIVEGLIWIAVYLGAILTILVIAINIISREIKFRRDFPPEM
ncbi:MAG TPA: hypothetical protein ENG74_03325, partial [Thermoplasmatales archaeon]|nr:hypothetical protein [Thermoplasmatales archaeon]